MSRGVCCALCMPRTLRGSCASVQEGEVEGTVIVIPCIYTRLFTTMHDFVACRGRGVFAAAIAQSRIVDTTVHHSTHSQQSRHDGRSIRLDTHDIDIPASLWTRSFLRCNAYGLPPCRMRSPTPGSLRLCVSAPAAQDGDLRQARADKGNGLADAVLCADLVNGFGLGVDPACLEVVEGGEALVWASAR